MKKILLLFGFFVVATTGIYAQVGIGTTDPATSAQLEVYAKDKGVLIPRVELTATDNFTPVEGAQVTSLLVYNTKTDTTKKGYEVYPGYYYWYNLAWNRVVSLDDFKNKNITNNIFKNSNVVTYNPVSNTITYVNKTGTQTISIVDIINKTNSKTTIKKGKIEPGSPGQVLTTNSNTQVEWQTLTDVLSTTLSKTDLILQGGLEFIEKSGVSSKTATGLVFGTETVTLKVGNIDITKIKAPTATPGTVVTVGTGGNLTTTQSVTLNQLKGETTTKSPSIVYVDQGGKVEQLTPGKKGTVLTTKDDKGNLEWKKIESSDITGQNLEVSEELKFLEGSGTEAVLKKVKIGVESIDISKVTVSSTDYTDKLLTVKDKKIIYTNKLPKGTTVSITNIQTKSPTAGTATQVVVIGTDGVATTTTIDDLTKVTASNGLTKTNSDIQLGGGLTKSTTITTSDKNTLAIAGLKTATITKTTRVVVMEGNSILKTVSATDFKGSGDYVTDGTPQETGNKIKTSEKDTKPESEKMITVIVDVTATTTSIRSSTINTAGTRLADFAKLGQASGGVISEIRVFSNGAIRTTGGVERHVAFSAATLEGSDGSTLVIRPGISSGGLVGPVFPGQYYIVVKYFKKK